MTLASVSLAARPAPNPGPGDDAGVERVCSRLLQERTPQLNALSRWSAHFARGTRRIERLMLMRRLAIDAEARGLEARADFFWGELQRGLTWLSQHEDRWRTYVSATVPDAAGGLDPQRLFHGMVRLGVLNVHLSYFYAWDEKDHPRAYVHLQHMRRLRGVAGLSSDDDRRLFGPLLAREIRYRQRRGEWKSALALGAELIRLAPDVAAYEDLFVEARRAAAVANLRVGRDGRPHRHDARALAAALHGLKTFRLSRPHSLAAFDAIARLHVARAEVLAARGQLAEALVDAEAALTYSPNVTGGTDLRTRLENDMQQLRIQSAEHAAGAPPASRRTDTQRSRQAAKGFRLVDAFRRSDEVRSVNDDLPVAQGRRVWETIGLGPLEPVDHRPLALNDAIQTVANAPPSSIAGLPDAWRLVSRDNPHLRLLDGDRVCLFIAHRLFAGPFAGAPEVPPPAMTPAPLFADAPARGSEPLMFWLLSGRNPFVKLLIVSAIVLASVATILGIREVRGRQVRADAYAALVRAREDGRHEQVLDAAERFFSTPLIGADDRAAEVDAAYSEALIRWFNQTVPGPEEAERRIQRYRQLLAVSADAEP